MDIEAIVTEHTKRLSAADSLLPVPRPWDDSDGTRLTVAEATALATRSRVELASSAALWRPLAEYRLDVRLAGHSPGQALDSLLAAWQRLLEEDTAASDPDTAAVVTRPSRDSAGSAELLRHRFAPARVLAVRPADRLGGGPPAVPGVRIRAAEPADLDTALRLQLELRRYDAQFGLVPRRPGEEEALRAQTRDLLARDATQPALWIAEVYGKPLGLLHIQLPPDSDWISGHVAAERVGYLASLNVAEEARSTGVGSALTAHAHQVFDESGVEVVLLHHALANPRSTPFWYSHGYRPLWTSWYRLPAR
ncbi:acetyltransferase [Saccharomonospora marina XMU15]|uniref:Acetyltransferase n=1 Tax=Saccharomonospora marina XMU15 TaxID=882083 RepID=H5X5D6_9PSEU|nr:GNAT family N-acetyltransferase [Saccharomonospora marina]EHR48950.1 acetyltransferase [Saccharomonospora marina XMU15]